MDFIILILSILVPVFIGIIITSKFESLLLKGVVILGLIVITFIVVNSFSQDVGLIQSAKNLWQSLKTISFVIVLFILGGIFLTFGPRA